MKRIFHKLISFGLVLIVLLSTVSFTVERHYCADDLVDFSFFDGASWCGDSQDASLSEECSLTKVPCCSSDQLIVQGHNDFQKVSPESLTQQQLFVAAFTYSYLSLFEDFDKESIPFADYTPPLLVRDILLLDQTFLI